MIEVQKQSESDLLHGRELKSRLRKGWRERGRRPFRHHEMRRIGVTKYGPMPNRVLVLAALLCETHPEISTDPRVRKGMPHVKNTRISVGHILSHIIHLGSIDATVNAYDPQLNQNQIHQALAYARDFLEEACDPTPSQVFG